MITTENRFFIFDRPLNRNFKFYIKRSLLPLLDYMYYFLLYISRKKYIKKTHYSSICSIFKDEAHNLKEWLEFHKIAGIEHFYLYNNFSSDNYLDVLKPYLDIGLVTLIDWPFEKGQMTAYKHCFENYKDKNNWICFLDLDEFIVPISSQCVGSWLKEMESFSCVLVYWKMFGTSGLVEGDDTKLTIEQYTVSWDKLVNIGKVFWNTSYEIADYSSMHIIPASVNVFGIKISIPPVNQFKKFIKFDIHRFVDKKDNKPDIQINHYWSKSYKDIVIKKFKRGDAFFGEEAPTRNLDSFMYHEYKNISTDYKIFKYLIELKSALGLTSYLFKK